MAEKASLGELDVVDVRLILRLAIQGGVLYLVAPVLDGETALRAARRAVLLRCVDRDDVGQDSHGLAILKGQLLSGQHLGRGREPKTGKRKTQYTLDPSDLIRPLTLPESPLMTEEMRMTVVTPIMMPSMVRPERSLLVRSVSIAIPIASLVSARVML